MRFESFAFGSIQIDGKTYDSRKSMHDYISSKKPGDTIRVNVWSQGMKKLVAVKLSETPAAQPVSQEQQQQPQQQPEQP